MLKTEGFGPKVINFLIHGYLNNNLNFTLQFLRNSFVLSLWPRTGFYPSEFNRIRSYDEKYLINLNNLSMIQKFDFEKKL